MSRHFFTAALFSITLLSPATALPKAEDADKDKEKKTGPAKEAPAKETPAKEEPAKPAAPASLPDGVLNFYGKVTGTVEAVDAQGYMKVKVTKAEADAEKSKATKPDSLAGMSIYVTPLAKKGDDDKAVLDPAAVAYIKGSKVGDPVTLDVRASSKGVVFRLLKVPTAGAK